MGSTVGAVVELSFALGKEEVLALLVSKGTWVGWVGQGRGGSHGGRER